MTSYQRPMPQMVLGLICIFYVVITNGSQAAEVKLNGQTFTLPDGCEIEQVAGPPLVNRPICADFDEQGRLYVADSSGSNEKVEVQLEKKPHRIVRLEDTNGDGRFDKSTVFADRMAFLEGTLWYDGSLYVGAPPQIWKLTDTDGDGVADRRAVWFDGKTLTHCANDVHGPYLGPDGWFYWCKGAYAEQTYERPGKKPFVTRAAHIFRRRPEGGLIEPVMTGGMANPVEVVFTPGGERIFTTTFLQRPGGGLRDGLIHAVYGGVYGRVHGALDGHPRTGPLMPVLSHLGAAAPCGLTRLETSQMGDGYRNNLLACLFNMRKVTRHVLQPRGGSFESHHEDFLVSDNLDFHPTDVLEDADGSVLVIDTGGWYKLCCPTSQLHKPDILGAIYRVRRERSHRVVDPRGKKIVWSELTDEQLTGLLADPRFAVRNRARQALGRRGAGAVVALSRVIKTSKHAEQRLHAVWALTLIDDPQARRVVRRALSDNDETVRQAALHSISVWRDREAEETLVKILESESSQNRRAAAEALGRVGSASSVPALLAAAADCSDRAVEHSSIYAVLEIADAAAARSALASDDVRVQRAALIALDQMPGGALRASEVRPLLDSAHVALGETAWWVAEHHPEWGDELAEYFRHAVKDNPSGPGALHQLSARLARFATNSAIQRVMGEGLADAGVNSETKLVILDAMAKSQLKAMPGVWSKPLYDQLGAADARLLGATVSAIRALSGSKQSEQPSARLSERLQKIARHEQLPAVVRLQALAALPRTASDVESQTLRFLCERLALDQPVRLRSLAVDVLLGTRLGVQQLLIVADALPAVGPMELKRLMELFTKSHDSRVGLRLIAALERSPAASSLATDQLQKQFSAYGNEVLHKAESLLSHIEEENRDKTQKLESVLGLVEKGDVRRGQRVFHGTKVACASCHAVGYLGGRVGPDLTRIGRIRSERDLLESILFPSASFVRSYEPMTIVTVDGRVFNGVIRDETSQQVTLQLDAEKVAHIAVGDIEERKPGTVSIMPTGLEKQLTPQQLADLVKFLKVAQ